YNTDLFEEDTIERMAHDWSCVLNCLVESPHLPINKIDALNAVRSRKKCTAAPGSYPRRRNA
ncbi:MAG TPA: hypothetical protein VGS41_10555, partial [Chthonomonadales bacterium]|nr:hypothetical protein [Chthonomonadales bacterium]